MRTPLALAAPILTMALALLVSACASTGGGRDYDETLLDCQAKADGVVKARYTPKWQAEVDRCLEEAGKK